MFYRHFKNKKIYRLVAFAVLEATEEAAVVYQAMYGEHVIWVRTRTNFFEEVQPGVPRFAPVTLPEMTADERVSCMSYLFMQDSPVLDVLREYMDSGLWLQDYEADERGELGEGVNRAVLSQDGLYNFLQARED